VAREVVSQEIADDRLGELILAYLVEGVDVQTERSRSNPQGRESWFIFILDDLAWYIINIKIHILLILEDRALCVTKIKILILMLKSVCTTLQFM
jgi:hypothetical protein